MTRRAFAIALLAGLAVALAGCGLRADRPTQPAGPLPITGVLDRAGTPVAGFLVKLYDDTEGVLAESTFTDGQGAYGFAGVPVGHWMVKVSSAQPGDLAYVRWFFDSNGPTSPQQAPPFDLAAHGLALLAPADSDTVAMPNLGAPLHFAWNAYQAPYSWANVRVTDTLGVQVWQSAQGTATTADWNGIGNDGPYLGQPVAPGRYLWRVKIHMGNGVQAATAQRVIVIAAPAP